MVVEEVTEFDILALKLVAKNLDVKLNPVEYSIIMSIYNTVSNRILGEEEYNVLCLW